MRKLAIILIFGLLPLFSIFLTARKLAEQKRTELQFQQRQELRLQLIDAVNVFSPEDYYFRLFDRLYLNLKRPEVFKNPINSGKMIRKFMDITPGQFHCYVFDEKGRMEPLDGIASPNRFVIGRIWDILAETPAYRPGEDEQKQLKIIQALFGAECNAGFLKSRQGQLISLKKRRADGYFFWQRFSNKSHAGMIAFVMPAISIDEIIRHYSADLSVFSDFCFFNHRDSDPVFATFNSNLAFMVKQQIQSESDGFLNHAGREWAVLNTAAGTFIAARNAMADKQQAVSGMINFCGAISLVFILILSCGKTLDLKRNFVPIGFKLGAIFLIVVAVPFAALMLTGMAAASDHRQVLTTRIENGQKQKLAAVEDDFVREERRFLKLCRKLHMMTDKDFSIAGFAETATGLVSDGEAVKIELRALDGEILLERNRPGFFEGLEKTNDAFARHLIRRHLTQRAKAESVALKRPPDKVFTDIFSSSDFGFAQIVEAHDQIHRFRFGSNELLFYFSYVSREGAPVALVIIYQSLEKARGNYLLRRVSELKNSGGEKLKVFNNRRNRWLGDSVDENRPLISMVKAAQLSANPQSTRINNVGHTWSIVTALPSVTLEPFSLVSVVDETPVSKAVARLNQVLFTSLFIVFIAAMAIARHLSETFMRPVKALEDGMRAMQRLDRNAHVQIEAGDEFGELGRAFNETVDNMQEMQLARIVQESLFPHFKPEIPGFDCSFLNQTAGDLGGDYCDVIKVNDREWLLVIGDVSGHGTPAALAMAMVKAAIFKASVDGIRFAELPAALSSMLLATLSRKKMMTMLFILLDAQSGRIQFINAGHNWPIIIRSSGEVEEIRVIGLPLGVREMKRPPEIREALLAPGETLFCYTDALIECRSPAGDVYGHNALYAKLEGQNNLSAEKLVSVLHESFQAFIQSDVREDDLTLLVVKRSEAGDNHV